MLIAVMSAVALAKSPRDSIRAGECPWGSNPVVTATMTTVYVNGEEYYVVGPAARAEFETVLKTCGEMDAVPIFGRWRAARRGVNISGAVSVPLLVVFGAGVATGAVGIGYFGSKAREAKELLIEELEG